MYFRGFTYLLCGFLVVIARPALCAEAPEPTPAQRALTLDEALGLAARNNRDLQAARERLRGSYTDVEKALAALLPTVTAQARLTINAPEVGLTIDQSGQVFSSAYQNAQISDLQQATSTTGSRGPAVSTLFNTYCLNGDPNRVVAPGVQQFCSELQNPNTNLDSSLNAAMSTAIIVPRAQIDGILAANLPLIVPSAYPALRGARLAYAAQQQQLAVTEAQILMSAATAFYAAAGTDELVTARRHAIEVAQKTVDSAQLRMNAGLVNRVELMRAQLALIQAEQRLLEVQDSRAAAYRTLATLLHIAADSFAVQPPTAPRAEVDGEQKLIEHAIDQRPELRSAKLQIQSFSQQVLSSWLGLVPSLSLFGNLRLTNATGFSGQTYGFAIGLQLDWLLFDGFLRDANRHNLESQRRGTLLRLEQLHDTVSDEVVNGRRTLLTKKQGLLSAERSVAMARETLELVRKQYQAGTSTQLDLLNSQDSLVVAEVALAQARFDLALAVLNLRRLTGEPLRSES
jgi:outer membrane protein TolC